MPISSCASTAEKQKSLRSSTQLKLKENSQNDECDRNLLKIKPALPSKPGRGAFIRSHSTLNASNFRTHDNFVYSDPVSLQTHKDGSVHVSRAQEERDKHPDRISLDRRGLTQFPFIDDEPKLRLLSLQHNLLNSLDNLTRQKLQFLVFLDLYDNQLDHIHFPDSLENLRVLLIGKNRVRKIEGLAGLRKLEVLDLHGNQIAQIAGLSTLSELKVLNLAGNQIKSVGSKDLFGLAALQELNLRRNRLRKLLGFAETPNLTKLFVSNNDIQNIEDISSLAKSPTIREISIDNNPVCLGGDCVSFLVSYLPQLTKLNAMQLTEQVRKAAMAWRRNKEQTNSSFMDLSQNFRREEVISNARTNWEFLRSQTKCLNTVSPIEKAQGNLKPDCDIIFTSLAKRPMILKRARSQSNINTTKVPVLSNAKVKGGALIRTPSQDSQNTSSSTTTSEFFKLPPILVPIVNKSESKVSESLSSVGANADSSVSSLGSGTEQDQSSESESEDESNLEVINIVDPVQEDSQEAKIEPEATDLNPINVINPINLINSMSSINPINSIKNPVALAINPETGSQLSVTNSNLTVTSSSSSENTKSTKSRSIKSALSGKTIQPRVNRASTAKVRKQSSPAPPKDREQGGDYLIEICGRHLNVYGQGALRFIDKAWSMSKANDVTTVKFNYVNFNGIVGVLGKLKTRFPNAEHFVFKETNICNLGQLNALAEIQGLASLFIEPDGNPVTDKDWGTYAVYRLAHWGLRNVNGREINDEDIRKANETYQSLSDIVLKTLPDVLLQPLLTRLRIDINCSEQNAKNWLLKADPALRGVICKEALQYKKGPLSQEDLNLRQKAKQHIYSLLDETTHAKYKLLKLDQEWPAIMHEFVQNTLLDYSHLDMYMKQKLQELK